ncbi:hypothetical protein F2Q65_13215 [Thiohalocapsa marina]|uniref:Uncharacterized protein n=1 Tax=Thiohalocapsa marina TaxID=424902 RepID=A0A5M8FGZ6_9GAMM|nr:hypothetical protein [Thiohalocapsa marina]KAA6184148.1 hypothetical protein F2Q65_13215 [Thiohalocapsa marina]
MTNKQAENLERIAKAAADFPGQFSTVRGATADYRLQSEEYAEPAPGAELIVCTPGRLNPMLGNFDNHHRIEHPSAAL